MNFEHISKRAESIVWDVEITRCGGSAVKVITGLIDFSNKSVNAIGI